MRRGPGSIRTRVARCATHDGAIHGDARGRCVRVGEVDEAVAAVARDADVDDGSDAAKDLAQDLMRDLLRSCASESDARSEDGHRLSRYHCRRSALVSVSSSG